MHLLGRETIKILFVFPFEFKLNDVLHFIKKKKKEKNQQKRERNKDAC